MYSKRKKPAVAHLPRATYFRIQIYIDAFFVEKIK